LPPGKWCEAVLLAIKKGNYCHPKDRRGDYEAIFERSFDVEYGYIVNARDLHPERFVQPANSGERSNKNGSGRRY
jgi:hypothetical protein